MPAPAAPSGSTPTPVVSSDLVLTCTVSQTTGSVLLLVDFTQLSGFTAGSSPLVTVLRNGTPVRGLAGASVPNGIVVGIDHEVPQGSTSTYRALAVIGASSWQSTAVAVAVPDLPGRTWLKRVDDPSRSVLVRLTDYPDWSSDVDQSMLRVVGRRAPIVVTSGRWAETGTLGVIVTEQAERVALQRLLWGDGDDDVEPVLLLQHPTIDGEPDRFVSAGAVSFQRPTNLGVEQARTVPVPVTVVDAPDVSSEVMVTEPGGGYDDDGSGTWDDLPAGRRYVDG